MDITELLNFSISNNASDLHLSAGMPPMIRVDGKMRQLDVGALEHKDVHSLIYDIMNDVQRKTYEEFYEADFSFEIPELSRFRVNVFNQFRGAGEVFHLYNFIDIIVTFVHIPQYMFRSQFAVFNMLP